VRELSIESRTVRVLHFAPEGAIRDRLAALPGIAHTTSDLEARDVDVTADITALPFEDGSFDLILCSHVLEHVPDDRAAMREMQRVLAPGGVAIVQSPVDHASPLTYEDPSVVEPAERLAHFSQPDHVRVYAPDLLDRLEAAGFAVQLDRYAERFAPDEVERFGLAPRFMSLHNELYICRR
jgi:SAM-dependent methyltransferase